MAAISQLGGVSSTAAASPATDHVGRRAGDPDKRAGGHGGNASVSQPHHLCVLHSVTVEAVSLLPCITFRSTSNARYIVARYNGARL